MQYFKTIEGMLSHAFEQRGLTDDNGNPIKATEQPMNLEQFIEHKKQELTEKVSNLMERVKHTEQ
jgi:hypothetical protein